MQKAQPLGDNFTDEKINAGRVAARLGKTADQANLNWVLADAEDDRDCRGRRFSRERSGGTAGRGDDGYAAADKISQERGQAIVAAIQPVVLDRYVLVFDVAGFLETFRVRRQ